MCRCSCCIVNSKHIDNRVWTSDITQKLMGLEILPGLIQHKMTIELSEKSINLLQVLSHVIIYFQQSVIVGASHEGFTGSGYTRSVIF